MFTPRRSKLRKGLRATLVLALLGTFSAGLSATEPAPAAEPADGEPTLVDCVDHYTQVRYKNYGYDHYVILHSRCEANARCRVSTDVAPKSVEVSVPSGKTVEVLTFRGSPARRFQAQVACWLAEAN